jgi:uncharacterized membrane protein YdjX (TVP38/TMEM64 family)
MVNLIGIAIIISITLVSIFFRRKINDSNNSFLKGLMKVNDIFNTIKFVFIMVIILTLFLFFKKN